MDPGKCLISYLQIFPTPLKSLCLRLLALLPHAPVSGTVALQLCPDVSPGRIHLPPPPGSLSGSVALLPFTQHASREQTKQAGPVHSGPLPSVNIFQLVPEKERKALQEINH